MIGIESIQLRDLFQFILWEGNNWTIAFNMSSVDGNVNNQSRHGSSASSIISTTSSVSPSDSATSCAPESDTIACYEDLVWALQQKVNTDTGKHKTMRICTTCQKEGCDKHGEKKKRSPQKKYLHLMKERTYKEERHANRDHKAKVKTSKRLNEGLMKIVSEVKHRINSFGMNVCFVCEMGPNYWNVFGSQAMVRHIYKSLTKIENGE